MEFLKRLIWLFLLLGFTRYNMTIATTNSDQLFKGFQNPPAEARPFVRWWWNGNQLESKEIKRQLDVLHSAGIGGVEINPIALPDSAKEVGLKSVVWLSKEWNELLVLAANEAKKRGMYTDLLVGSGWPFGGEFLKEDETIQRIIVNNISCSGGQMFNENKESLYKKAVAALTQNYEAAKSYELFFMRLIPKNISTTSQIIDLTNKLKESDQFIYEVPAGEYELIYGFLQRGYRDVMHGAPGAAGPVMNHYSKKITIEYLSRLNKISEDTGIPLSQLIRALFCDSIELDGANWTDGLADIFFQTYHYQLDPYFPFIFYHPFRGYPTEDFSPKISDELKRVRHDYNKLLVQVFNDNFTKVFQEFCTKNGVKCRYQAYGIPFLMGIMEGNLIPDIPESNNWIYSTDMNTDSWYWNQNQGYMLWNLYASSGGHLTGRKIISCESMTNTKGVFKTSLEEIKQHDDMNFITGINHTILHGYNYSPVAAGFPGWIRYGSYFSEQNTWWPYFPKWVEYNARLSYIFQQSQPMKNIAILAPQADIWSNKGLSRVPFQTMPWYSYRLWEPISQAGNSCDYISEEIIKKGVCENGTLTYGLMKFKAIVLTKIASLDQETALKLKKFVKEGGKLIVVETIPDRSVSMQNATQNDSIVKNAFAEIIRNFPERFFKLKNPESEVDLLPWTTDMLKKINIEADVAIENPDKNVYQIRTQSSGKDVYFFTNSGRKKTITLKTTFPSNGKTPWLWNPEDGTRKVFPYDKKKNQLNIVLQPLQSLLLVFDPEIKGKTTESSFEIAGKRIMSVDGLWHVCFEHMNGRKFERDFDKLFEFGTSNDVQLNSFAGIVKYSTSFNSDGKGDWLRLGKTNRGITEVYLNGKLLGLNWFGQPTFSLKGKLLKGNNNIEIKYTTVLSNYAFSIKDNPTAQLWTSKFDIIPIGLEGEVGIYSK